MNQAFEYPVHLDMCSVDFMGHWQLSGALRAMQDAGSAHCTVLHQSFEDLRERGVAWVITRSHLQMDEYPTLGQQVLVRTWPGETKHMFFPRYCTFESEGKTVGRAVTMYVLLDLETRKIAAPSRLSGEIAGYDIPAPLPFPGSIKNLSTAPSIESYLPVYTDLDMNCHVNNTRYADWFMNRFPIEKHAHETLCDFLVHYNHELVAGEPVTFELRQQEDICVLQGKCGEDARLGFAVQGTWKPRATR
ncbi:MAG: thioesterase [Clostridia bacterium]